MAHKAHVLRGERTLRLHYANCKSYNADFDGKLPSLFHSMLASILFVTEIVFLKVKNYSDYEVEFTSVGTARILMCTVQSF